MFTGIVTDVGTIAAVEQGDAVRRLSIASGYDAIGIDIGASISCAGVCMTVVDRRPASSGSIFTVEAGAETLALTNVGAWQVGTRVNLERSLRLGDELGGHLVLGHADGQAIIAARKDLGATTAFSFEAPEEFARFIAFKGSVALDGASLTVNRVERARFDCLLIPHTLAVTTWGERRVGDRVNLEIDLMARYVARLSESR